MDRSDGSQQRWRCPSSGHQVAQGITVKGEASTMIRPLAHVVVTVVVSRDGAVWLCVGSTAPTAALAGMLGPASGTPTFNTPAAAAATTIQRWNESVGCITDETPG